MPKRGQKNQLQTKLRYVVLILKTTQFLCKREAKKYLLKPIENELHRKYYEF